MLKDGIVKLAIVVATIMVLAAWSICNAATITLSENVPGMTLKAGDELNLNGFTVTSQVTVAGSNVTISGPGRIRVAPGNSTDKTKRTKGILINSPNINNVTIENLEISGDGVRTGVIGERGIQALDGNSNLTIRGVTIRNIMVPILLRSHNNVLIEHCKFGPNNITNSSDHCEAISDRNSNDVTIRYCEFFNIRNSGIIVSGNDAQRLGGNAYRWKIYHNVFWYSPDYPALGIGSGAQHGFAACYNGQPAIDWEVHNNTSVNHYGYNAGVDLEKPTNAKIYDNLWYSLGKDPEGRTAGLNVASGSNGNLLAASNPFAGDWTKGDFTRKPGVTAGAAWPFTGNPGPVETPKPTPNPTATPTPEPTATPTPAPTATPAPEPSNPITVDEVTFLGRELYHIESSAGPCSILVNGTAFQENSAPYEIWINKADYTEPLNITVTANGRTYEMVYGKATPTPEPTPDPSDCTDLAAQLAEAQDQIGELTERVAGLESEKAALLTANASLTAANAELQESVDALSSTNDQLTASLNEKKYMLEIANSDLSAIKLKLSTALDRARELVGGLE